MERHLPVVGTGGRGGPAIQDDEEKREFFDDAEQLRKKVDRAVEWVRQSKHAIVFTGAGVSTRWVGSYIAQPSGLVSAPWTIIMS